MKKTVTGRNMYMWSGCMFNVFFTEKKEGDDKALKNQRFFWKLAPKKKRGNILYENYIHPWVRVKIEEELTRFGKDIELCPSMHILIQSTQGCNIPVHSLGHLGGFLLENCVFLKI